MNVSDVPRRRALSHYPVHTLDALAPLCLFSDLVRALSFGRAALRSYRDTHTRRQTDGQGGIGLDLIALYGTGAAGGN